MIAVWFNKTWGWIVAAALIFLIGLSRLYLGMHFPTDALTGWLIGALLLWAILRCEKPALAWLNQYKPGDQILIALGISLVFVLVGALARLVLGNWVIPSAWVELAGRAGTINPLDLSGLISNAGVFFGLAAGSILLELRGGFDAKSPIWQRALRYAIGVIGIFALWYGLGRIFPRGETLLPYLLRYLRYTLLGVWIMYLAPLLFIWLGISKTLKKKPGF